jgi:hypothetical protein
MDKKGRPMAPDPKAVSATSHAPAFVTPPAGAPVYHGFQVLEDVVVDGFTLGKITDFEAETCAEGDAFVLAPDNSRAGLVWEVGEAVSISEVLPIETGRWGVWGVTFPYAMDGRENARRNLKLIVPELKLKWEEWRRKFPNT